MLRTNSLQSQLNENVDNRKKLAEKNIGFLEFLKTSNVTYEKSLKKEKGEFGKYKQVPLLLIFRNKSLESAFSTYFYWLDRRINRLTLTYVLILVGFAANVFLDVSEFLERDSWTDSIVFHTIASMVSLIPVSLLIIFATFRFSTKYILINELFYVVFLVNQQVKLQLRYQTHFYSISATFLMSIVLVLGFKHRFAIQFVAHAANFVIYFPLTAIVNSRFASEAPGNISGLRFHPFVFHVFNSIMVVTLDYVTESKVRNVFTNLVMMKKHENELLQVKEAMEKLLYNIIPYEFIDDGSLMKKLMASESPSPSALTSAQGTTDWGLNNKCIIKEVQNGSLLFGDLVAFTHYAESVDVRQLISILNAIFAHYDFLTLLLNLEKVSTQGDAFIVMGQGSELGGSDSNHVMRQVLFAYGMIKMLRVLCAQNRWKEVEIRIGIAAGRYYLVSFGSHRSGINFDVVGDTIRKAQTLQERADVSTVMCPPDMSQYEVPWEGRIVPLGEIFHFEMKDNDSMELKEEFLTERSLVDYMDSVIEECQRNAMASKDIGMQNQSQSTSSSGLPSPASPGSFVENMGDMSTALMLDTSDNSSADASSSSVEKLSVKSSLLNKLFSFGVGDIRYVVPILSFKSFQMQKEFELFKYKNSTILTLVLYVFMAMFDASLLVFFFFVNNLDLFYSPFAIVLYSAVLCHALSFIFTLCTFKLTHWTFVLLRYIVFYVNIAAYVVAIAFFALEDRIPNDLNADAVEEIMQYIVIVMIGFSSSFPAFRVLLIFPTQTIIIIVFKLVRFQESFNFISQVLSVICCSIFAVYAIYVQESIDVSSFSQEKKIEESKKTIRSQLEKNEVLILSIIPKPVMLKLQTEIQNKKKSADIRSTTFECSDSFVCFLRARLKDSHAMPIRKKIQILSSLFTRFDEILIGKKGIKIKTVDDIYIFVAEKVEKATSIIWKMINDTDDMFPSVLGLHFGLNFGPLSAGVLGTLKFRYDIMGNTVNVSSRLCSSCQDGIWNSVHILAEQFSHFSDCGVEVEKKSKVVLKGKGECETMLIKLDTATE